ncbi:AfsR/SARP family transcriptional regulator [Mesobacterium pallidum]|uniref:AfsR/SARP family transcriptional regulator n=1 Tax=Mesobacterium pallidum TaxID=2872037 RepID=UPI001EE1746A|nr:BTAD domain-containing putative transcriptional regulator [Mesobacterium pallidum]
MAPVAVNAALIGPFSGGGFLRAALGALPGGGSVHIVTGSEALAEALGLARHGLDAAGLDTAALESDLVHEALTRLAGATEGPLAIDMSWCQAQADGTAAFETWGALAERLAAEGVGIVALYNHDLMIEDQLRAAMQLHPHFLAPEGLTDNPFFLPVSMREAATLDEQLNYLLGRAVPGLAGLDRARRADRVAARGADPKWLEKQMSPQPLGASAERWHIHCFGQLRVYVGGNKRVNWQIKGGSPKKTKTLFAYLLQAGEKGVHADRIGELLWPGDGDEQTKRARLHYAVAMLRKTLGGKDALLRTGEYYRLNIPPGSWIDIASFEQLCRRGLVLANAGRDAEALELFAKAERLYVGDLFADLPQDYVDDEYDDWCLARRTWLREVAIKLHRDMSRLLRKADRTRAALEHCQKALGLDPASDVAHAETLRVFAAQGRRDALTRQYKQYRAAAASLGDLSGRGEMDALYHELMGGHA